MQHKLLRKDFSLDEAEALQEKYSLILNIKSQKSVINTKIKDIKWVVGVDTSYYNEGNEEWGVSCAVLWNLPNYKMENYCFAKEVIRFSYKPGFLGFRECNLFAQAIKKLPETPDIIMCDGHGIIHPKRFGEAVQLGLALNIPSFGVAKNPFIGYSMWKTLKRKKGEKVPVWAHNPKKSTDTPQELLGNVLCLNDGMKPIFISVGYKTIIDLAIKVALKTTKKHRQPEPLYLADYLSRQKIKDCFKLKTPKFY
jgi:deoxyribonuclease V